MIKKDTSITISPEHFNYLRQKKNSYKKGKPKRITQTYENKSSRIFVLKTQKK